MKEGVYIFTDLLIAGKRGALPFTAVIKPDRRWHEIKRGHSPETKLTIGPLQDKKIDPSAVTVDTIYTLFMCLLYRISAR